MDKAKALIGATKEGKKIYVLFSTERLVVKSFKVEYPSVLLDLPLADVELIIE